MQKYLSIKVIIGSLLFGLGLFVAIMAILWVSRPEQQLRPPATAVVLVVPAPTETPLAAATTVAILSTPTPDIFPTPMPGTIAIGGYVQVSGTGGDGLRLRADAGLQGDVRLLAIEAEVFLVRDGPQEVDGYTWWYLVTPVDETRGGWAVSNYLTVIQNP